MKRTRNHLYTDFDLNDGKTVFDDKTMRYLCYGVEVCPKTKRKHHQGFIQWKQPRTIVSAKKKAALPKAHFEIMRGTPQENVDYCSKDGDFHEFGVFTSMGARTDIDAFKELIDSGKTEENLADANFQLFVQYGRAFKDYRRVRLQASTRAFRRVTVILLAGCTGCGKSRRAIEESGFTISGSDLRPEWWDGYQGEKTLCIDDYANQCSVTRLLHLLDGYQCRLPIKGTHTYAAWELVFITTNLVALHQQASDEHQRALTRRISFTFEQWVPGTPIVIPTTEDLLQERKEDND